MYCTVLYSTKCTILLYCPVVNIVDSLCPCWARFSASVPAMVSTAGWNAGC